MIRNGGVAHLEGEIPGPHNDDVTIVIQVRQGKGWLAFRRYRTRDGGHFEADYPFHRTTRPTTYEMRAQALAAQPVNSPPRADIHTCPPFPGQHRPPLRSACGSHNATQQMPTHTVDLKRLYDAADHKRREQGKSWRQVARELDLGLARFTWIAQGVSVSVETFATLLAWLETDAKQFLIPIAQGTRARPTAPPADAPSTLRERLDCRP